MWSKNSRLVKLNLDAATERVEKLISQLKIDPYFLTNDEDIFTAVCIQTMFLLEATYNNDCTPPKLPEFPFEKMRQQLKDTGELSWQDCQIIKKEKLNQYESNWHLRCPNCQKGTIVRYKDDTPGFRESAMTACEICGLDGDGSHVHLQSRT